MFFALFSQTLRWINPLLFIVVVFSLFYLIRVIISPPSVEFSQRQEQTEDKIKRPQSLSIDEYAGLLKDNTFGIRGEFRLIRGSDESLKESQTITLVGTVSGGDYNYAIVLDSSGRQEIFRKGQEIYGLGMLTAVHKDKIVIRGPSGKRIFELADLIITEVKDQRAVIKRGPEGLASLSAQRSSQNVFTINSDALRQAIENPREILTDARFIPNIVEGRQEGFVIREIKKGGVYDSLGLQDGDVLLRVNEFPITGPDGALQAFTALKGMDRIELDIMRKGQRISMTYQIR